MDGSAAAGSFFVEGAAVFALIDSSVKSCDQLPGNTCRTPCDYCCEPPDVLKATTATIQLVDDDGKPQRVRMNGQRGLKPLAELTIAGEVASRDASGSLVINARRIHIHPGKG
jgi:hypothetical protein